MGPGLVRSGSCGLRIVIRGTPVLHRGSECPGLPKAGLGNEGLDGGCQDVALRPGITLALKVAPGGGCQSGLPMCSSSNPAAPSGTPPTPPLPDPQMAVIKVYFVSIFPK